MDATETRQLTVDERILDTARELDDASFRAVYRRLATGETGHRYRGRVLAKRWRLLEERGAVGAGDQSPLADETN